MTPKWFTCSSLWWWCCKHRCMNQWGMLAASVLGLIRQIEPTTQQNDTRSSKPWQYLDHDRPSSNPASSPHPHFRNEHLLQIELRQQSTPTIPAFDRRFAQLYWQQLNNQTTHRLEHKQQAFEKGLNYIEPLMQSLLQHPPITAQCHHTQCNIFPKHAVHVTQHESCFMLLATYVLHWHLAHVSAKKSQQCAARNTRFHPLDWMR